MSTRCAGTPSRAGGRRRPFARCSGDAARWSRRWSGSAPADSFRARWSSEISPRLGRAVQDLETDGQELTSHAEEQDETSGTGTGGGSGAAGGGAALGPVAPFPGIGSLPESPVGRMIAREPESHIASVLPQFPGADLMVCDIGPRDRTPQEFVLGDLGLDDRLIRCFPDLPTPIWPVPAPLPDVELPDPLPAPIPLPDVEPLPAPMPDLMPRPLPDVRPLPAPMPVPDSWPLPQPLPAPLPVPDPWPFPAPMPRIDVHLL